MSFQRNGPGVVIGRNSFDPARWKRYRGGRTGSLWIDRTGDGEFEELVRLAGNLADPMWIGRRIYFLSDHEGVGNIYSVTPPVPVSSDTPGTVTSTPGSRRPTVAGWSTTVVPISGCSIRGTNLSHQAGGRTSLVASPAPAPVPFTRSIRRIDRSSSPGPLAGAHRPGWRLHDGPVGGCPDPTRTGVVGPPAPDVVAERWCSGSSP